MLEVIGFRGLTFNTEKVGSQEHAVTPPYDVISPEERARLTAESPYSMAHLLLPEAQEGRSQYENAAYLLNQWIAEDVLLQDEEPYFYLLRQSFVDLDGNAQVRRGFFAAVRLPEANERIVLGHERTFHKPVEDRLNLTAATQANLGAVFVLYPDQEHVLDDFLGQMERREADGQANTIDGVKQEFWRVPYDQAVTRFFWDKTLYIADGHHRFQTAIAYRDAMREKEQPTGPQPYDYVLMGFVPLNDRGLKIFPPHRLLDFPEGFDADQFLEALTEWFEVQPVEGELNVAVEDAPGECVMGVAIHGKGDYLLTLRDMDRTKFLGDDRGPAWRDLDVAVLHRGVIERILGVPEGAQFVYEKDVQEALRAAHAGDKGLAFILRATRADQIRACAEASEPMPQKATYFFPKLPSGAVIHRLVE